MLVNPSKTGPAGNCSLDGNHPHRHCAGLPLGYKASRWIAPRSMIVRALTALSMLLATATVALWVRSYSDSDKAAWTRVCDGDTYLFEKVEAYDIAGFLVLSYDQWNADGRWYRQARKQFSFGIAPMPPNYRRETGVFLSWPVDPRSMRISLVACADRRGGFPAGILRSTWHSNVCGPYSLGSGYALVPMWAVAVIFMVVPAVHLLLRGWRRTHRRRVLIGEAEKVTSSAPEARPVGWLLAASGVANFAVTMFKLTEIRDAAAAAETMYCNCPGGPSASMQPPNPLSPLSC
jgi:hypothetical protein